MGSKMAMPTFQIDSHSTEPVYRQIALEIRRAVLDGRLDAGSRLPATRDLARQLRVNLLMVLAPSLRLEAKKNGGVFEDSPVKYHMNVG